MRHGGGLSFTPALVCDYTTTTARNAAPARSVKNAFQRRGAADRGEISPGRSQRQLRGSRNLCKSIVTGGSKRRAIVSVGARSA
jgi:hypothetical protein